MNPQGTYGNPEINLIEATPPVKHLASIMEGSSAAPSPLSGSRQGSSNSLDVEPPTHRNSATTTHTKITVLNPQEGWYEALEQAVRRDDELVEEWKSMYNIPITFSPYSTHISNAFVRLGSMDVLLIFATLFGAIITAFLVETYRDLKMDDANTVAYLSIIASTLGAHGIPEPQPIAGPSSRTRRVNRLWFASLLITIGSAVFAMLAKQWVAEYSEGLASDSRGASDGRLHREARFREFRFAGVRRWYVPQIIGALPIILHVALFLFSVGLIDFFWELDRVTSVIILIFTSVTAGLYLISAALPAVTSDCPYRTPLSHLLANVMRSIHAVYDPSIRRVRKFNALEASAIDEDPDNEKSIIRAFTGGALNENEKVAVDNQKALLDEEFLVWVKHSTRSDSLANWAQVELDEIAKNPKPDPKKKRRKTTKPPNGAPPPDRTPTAATGGTERLNRDYNPASAAPVSPPLSPTTPATANPPSSIEAPPAPNRQHPASLPSTDSMNRGAPSLAQPQPHYPPRQNSIAPEGLGFIPGGRAGTGGDQA